MKVMCALCRNVRLRKVMWGLKVAGISVPLNKIR